MCVCVYVHALQIKGMSQHLNRSNKFQSDRKNRFSVKFMEDLETLVGGVATEICQSHIRVRADRP